MATKIIYSLMLFVSLLGCSQQSEKLQEALKISVLEQREAAINKLIDEYPDFADAVLARAQIVYAIGSVSVNDEDTWTKFKEAQKDFSAAIALDSTLIEAYYGRAECYQFFNNLEQKYKDLEKVAELDTSRAASIYREIADQLGKTEHERASRYYEKALAFHYQLSPGVLNGIEDKMASCYYFSDQYIKAEETYTKIIDKGKADYWAYLHRGESRVKLGDLKGAMGDYQKLIVDYPESAYLHMEIARIHVKDKNYKAAEVSYTSAISYKPLFDYYVERAGLRLMLNDYQGAIDDYEVLISKGCNGCNGNLGWYYFKLGDYEKSIKYSKLAIEETPRENYVMYNIAIALLANGDTAAALDKYKSTFSISDQSTNQGAITDLQDLIKLGVQEKSASRILEEVFGVYGK